MMLRKIVGQVFFKTDIYLTSVFWSQAKPEQFRLAGSSWQHYMYIYTFSEKFQMRPDFYWVWTLKCLAISGYLCWLGWKAMNDFAVKNSMFHIS